MEHRAKTVLFCRIWTLSFSCSPLTMRTHGSVMFTAMGKIAAMNRRYPEMPMAGVGAIIFRGDTVLLVKRGNPPSAGKWSIPGGLVELGESLETAVRREVREEVGLDVKVIDLVAALDRVIYDSNSRIEYHYILLDFLCESVLGDPVAATDADESAFVPLEELPLYDLTRGTELVIKRAYQKAMEKGSSVYGSFL